MNKHAFVRRQDLRSSVLLSVAALATTGMIAAAAPAGAAVTTGGGADARNRPGFVRDDQGIALALCADAVNCEPADAADPLHGGYFAAEAAVGPFRIIFGIETAAGEDAAGNPTDQAIVANVARFRAEGLRPGGRYVVKDPWGSTTVFADNQGDVDFLAEGGGEAGSPLGSGPVKTFLRRLNAPAGFLGNLDTAGRVTGSPTGFNRVQITGPGVNATQRNFIVNGQLRPNMAMSTVNTPSLKLGSITKATASVGRVNVSSFGSAALSLNVTKGGANPSAFAVTNNCAAAAPGSACNVTVSYTPRANRDVSAVLTLDDPADLTPARRVTVTGVANDTRAPKVASSNPAKGADNVRPGKSIKVGFSEAVLGAKSGLTLVDASGDKVAARVSRVRQTSTYKVNPRQALDRNATYRVQVNGGAKAVRDLAGNAARDISWRFGTR
jgi:methionine-rich copper-binding protein CopC